MTQPTGRVLILDGDLASSLAIVRSLAKQGLHCDVGASVETDALCQYSRHVRKLFRYPCPLKNAEDFVVWVDGHLQNFAYDLAIPVTERSLVPLAESSLMMRWASVLTIPPLKALAQVLDKNATFVLAANCDVPVPFGYAINSVAEITALLAKLTYPVVLKPCRSISNAAGRKQLRVAYAFDEKELLNTAQTLLTGGRLLVQQYVQGVGVELLVDQGKVVYAFQHQRLHELPLSGGGSTFRRSVPVEPKLLAAATGLVEGLAWHGVAMVEFKWEPKTQAFWLMEINGRF